MNAFLQVIKGKPTFCFFSLLWWITKEGFIWVIWTALLSPGWNCSLWSGGSLPGVFFSICVKFSLPLWMASVYCELPLEGLFWDQISLSQWFPTARLLRMFIYSALPRLWGRVSLRPLLATSVNKDLGRWQRRPGRLSCYHKITQGLFFFFLLEGTPNTQTHKSRVRPLLLQFYVCLFFWEKLSLAESRRWGTAAERGSLFGCAK